MAETLKALFLPTLCFGLWLFSDYVPFQREIIVYRTFCKSGWVDGTCTSREEIANTTTFKAIPDQQTVLYWQENGDPPRRYKHCAVRDSENWSCQLGDEFEAIPRYQAQMVNGKFQDVAADAASRQTVFVTVPKWKWWIIRVFW